ncbi:MAG TPA: DUF308 domain-containing protein [Candidatus Coprenecus stercorigallinarum]|nr:DUF308 domain-containing protein [Candidatus Coprenecus stercorigallinarum]
MKPTNVFFDRSYGYARAIIALVGGLILVIWPETVKNSIMIILGSLILAVGIVSIVLSYTGKWRKEKVPLLLLNSIVDIAFGLVLIIFPKFFTGLIMFVFGLILLIFGLGEIINLFRTAKAVRVPWPLYIGPAVTLILGVAMFFFPDKSGNALFVIFGATLLLYSISEFASTYTIRKEMKNVEVEIEKDIKQIEE